MPALLSQAVIDQAGVDLSVNFSEHLASMRQQAAIELRRIQSGKNHENIIERCVPAVDEFEQELGSFLTSLPVSSDAPLIRIENLLTNTNHQNEWTALLKQASGDFDALMQLSDDVLVFSKISQIAIYLRLAPQSAYIFGDCNKATELYNRARAKSVDLFGADHPIVRQIDSELALLG